MITLDASVVIAHLQPRDVHHEVASAYLREHAGQRLLIHPLTLTEVLVGGVRAGRGEELLDDLYSIGVETVKPRVDEPLRLAILRVESGLKLPDCCALDTALCHESALATFDAKLAHAARKRRLTVGPGTD